MCSSDLMVGTGAETTNVTLMMVLPVDVPVPAMVIEPLYVVAFRPVGLAVTVMLNVPVFGVVPDNVPVLGVGLDADDNCSQPELDGIAVNVAAAPPPETATVCVGGFKFPTA